MAHTITLLDGAWGTNLWALAEQNGIPRLPTWRYNIEHPSLITELIRRYIAAGSRFILTNTFQANRMMISRQSDYTVRNVVTAGTELVKREVNGTGIRTALSVGPLAEFMEPYGDLEEEDVEEIYDEVFSAGVEAGADVIWLETFLDLGMLRVACRTAKKYGLPVFCSMTFEANGRTIMGNRAKDIARSLEEDGAYAVGLNCSFGPDKALPILREFRENASGKVLFKPNAGLPVTSPDGSVTSPYTPEMFLRDIAPAFELADYIGGCCGTSPEYISLLSAHINS